MGVRIRQRRRGAFVADQCLQKDVWRRVRRDGAVWMRVRGRFNPGEGSQEGSGRRR